MAQPAAMVDDAYQQLRRMILTGKLAARDRLSQRALAKQLGMSTMPVVEALRRLEQDGLVERLPQYGAYVKAWTSTDIEEAYLLRRALEGEASRQMARYASEAEKQILLQLSEQVDAAMHRQDADATVELELAFHLHVARCSRLPKLYQLLETAHILSRSLYMWTGRLDNLSHIADHKPIAHAIQDGDGEAAQRAMFEHIDHGLDWFHKHQAQSALDLSGLTATNAAGGESSIGILPTNRWLSNPVPLENPLEAARVWLGVVGMGKQKA